VTTIADLYNLACAEAQLGENDAALEHLRAALVERPGFAEDIRTDSDLEPLPLRPALRRDRRRRALTVRQSPAL
jgi:hypothetical protein